MSPLIVSAILGVLQLIEQVLLPNLSATSTVAKVITMLEAIVPVVIKEAQDLAQPVRNIILALRNNGAITAEQLDQLDALEAKLDADFDAAAEAAEAADAAVVAKPAGA